MRIQHNIPAMSAYRNYSNNTSAVAKNLEKLSSGYKINRAGDDAAGLAVSEKMRAQITGLEVAQKNAKDGISLVQTAEGALTEVHDMLNRMYELAELASNGTYDDEVDRANYQKEINSLTSEINRIADSVNFNGINLLDGSLQKGVTVNSTTANVAADGFLPEVGQTLGVNTVLHQDASDATGGTSFSVDLHNVGFSGKDGEAVTIEIGNAKITVTNGTGADITAMDAEGLVGEILNATGGCTITTDQGAFSATAFKINGQDFTVTDGGNGRLTFTQNNAPTSASEEVNGEMKVTVSGTGAVTTTPAAATKAQYKITLTAPGSLAVGSKFTIGTQTYTIVGTTDAANNKYSAGDFTAAKFAELYAANVTDTNYDITANGADIIFTAKVAGAVGGGTTGVPGAAPGAPTGLTDTVNGEAFTAATAAVVVAGADEGATNNIGGALVDYNFKTDVIKNVTAGDTARLASTYFKPTAKMMADGASMKIGTATYTFSTKDADKNATGNTIYVGDLDLNTQAGMDKAAERLTVAAANNSVYTVGYHDGAISVVEKVGQTDLKGKLGTLQGIQDSLGFNAAPKTGKALTLQIGDTAEDFNKLSVSVSDCHAAAMGIGSIDISTQDGASDAMAKIKDAINYVSSTRGDLGATQNRLEHTINNLSVMQENIQDAESTIRDVDIAKEMMAYTKNNILVQSAQAMLAQANQLPQGVLQLLQ